MVRQGQELGRAGHPPGPQATLQSNRVRTGGAVGAIPESLRKTWASLGVAQGSHIRSRRQEVSGTSPSHLGQQTAALVPLNFKGAQRLSP